MRGALTTNWKSPYLRVFVGLVVVAVLVLATVSSSRYTIDTIGGGWVQVL